MVLDWSLTKSYFLYLTDYSVRCTGIKTEWNEFYVTQLYHKDLNVQLSAHLTLVVWLQQSNGQKRQYNPLISCNLGLFEWSLVLINKPHYDHSMTRQKSFFIPFICVIQAII